MAVVSISRIQVRRGRKNQGSGLPQLASGEIGWAIDTQELFIGNGSVSEGAPYVGNTKILTETDNILDFIGDYEYRSNDAYIQTGPGIGFPVTRSILDRLNDNVSVRAFGAFGDGTIQTSNIQRAIDQLYLNSVTVNTSQSRVVLYIEAGDYVIDNTIYLPPYATIVGDGIDKTNIVMIGDGPAFQTVSSLSTPGSYVSNEISLEFDKQARNIEISGLTLKLNNNKGFNLSSCRDSIFKNIKIIGNWNSGDPSSIDNYSFLLKASSQSVSTNGNIFENIKTQNTAYAVYSDYDTNLNTWKNCSFDTHYIAFSFGENIILGDFGQSIGPCKNFITESLFDNIDHQALLIENGNSNKSESNKFFSVGNQGGSENDSIYPVIQFNKNNNISVNDWFQRSDLLMYNETFTLHPYVPELVAPNIYASNKTHVLTIGQSTSPEFEKLFRLPGSTPKSYEIDYFYISSVYNAKRSGKLTIIADPTNLTSSELIDEYDYIGDSAYQESLEFSIRNRDYNNDFLFDTIDITMLNSAINDEAKLYFRVKTKA